MKYIDSFLNNITMYRLVLYYLIALLIIAVGFSGAGFLHFSPLSLMISTSVLIGVSWITNKIFAYVFKAHTNVESFLITALILALIITPIQNIHDLPFLFWAAVWAMATKFIFAIGKKHLFNPAAAAVFITSIGLNQSASWWIGTAVMIVPVLIGGVLIVRKIRRVDLVFSFFAISLFTSLAFGVLRGSDLLTILRETILYSSTLFFAFVMLTEPLTTPPTKQLQIAYGSLVGFLFSPFVHLGSLYTTPESALLIGNIFSYIISPKQKLYLSLKTKAQLAPDLYDFIFHPDKKPSFTPGQYLEWTLPHSGSDSRGNRRYFTIASSPTESDLLLGIKIPPTHSSYKKQLLLMQPGEEISAGQLSGDFTLPKDTKKRLVFIAGGIGITPFRSMLKYLIDTNQKRDIILLYSNRDAEEVIYKDVLGQAVKQLGIKVVCTLTGQPPQKWWGKVGRIDAQMIREEVPDYKERFFYLSGPQTMVNAFEKTLTSIGINKNQIITDYFPGFA